MMMPSPAIFDSNDKYTICLTRQNNLLEYLLHGFPLDYHPERYLCTEFGSRNSTKRWHYIISIDDSRNEVFTRLSQVPCHASSWKVAAEVLISHTYNRNSTKSLQHKQRTLSSLQMLKAHTFNSELILFWLSTHSP